jgi:phytanoyl-CoA hydroxylase
MEAEFDRIAVQIRAADESVDATWRGASIEKIKAKDDQIVHTHNVHRFSSIWLQAIQSPRFLDTVGEILGPDIVLNHTKLFLKPPEKGSPFPMHQDWTYFPTFEDTMMAAIIHLTEATDEMGCVRVYPGSNELGRVMGTGGQTDTAQDTLKKYPIEGATVLEAERGDVVFFSYFTLHGSMPNRSSKSRKTVLVQMYSGSDRMEDGVSHPDERLTLRGWNHYMTRNRAVRNNTLET